MRISALVYETPQGRTELIKGLVGYVLAGQRMRFTLPADAAKLAPMRASVTDPGTDKDAAAYLAFLDAQPQTNKKAKAGVEGYCMGGPLSFRTAAAVPSRIGAVVTFHGGGLVTTYSHCSRLLVKAGQRVERGDAVALVGSTGF